MDDLKAWIGRTEIRRDTITPTPLAALDATFDYPQSAWPAGRTIAPLTHWLYFLPLHRQSEIGADGHAKRGGFLPPVPLPRRMWAGSQFEFRAPLFVGDEVERTSTIDDVTVKEGRTGKLVFVKVRHELSRVAGVAVPAKDAAPAIVEFHDIVYRANRQPGDVDPAPVKATAPGPGTWTRRLVPDDVLLFRYSALTFNGHRIHYDRKYVTEVEGYPGLIVHGPLIATLLVDLLRRHAPGSTVKTFRFKAVRPTFDLNAFAVSAQREGNAVKLWAQDHEGFLTMEAAATLED